MNTRTVYPIILFALLVPCLRAEDAYVQYTNALAHIVLINGCTPERDVWAEKADDAKMRLIQRASTDTNYLTQLYSLFLSQKSCSPSAPKEERLFGGFLSYGLYQIIRACSVSLAYEALMHCADPQRSHNFSTETVLRTLGDLVLSDSATNCELARCVWTSLLAYTNHPDAHVRGEVIGTLLAAQRTGTAPVASTTMHTIMNEELERASSVHERAFLYEEFIRQGSGSMKHEYVKWLSAQCTNHTLTARDRNFVETKQRMFVPVHEE